MITITLHNTNISIDKNMKVDHIETYLQTNQVLSYPNCQTFKIDKEVSITLLLDQNFIYGTTPVRANYLRVINSEVSERPFYYFIVSASWSASGSVNLKLLLDTVNTFITDDNDFTSQTTIIREHRDRFTSTSDLGKAFVLIDKTDEGFNPVKIRKGDTYIHDRKLEEFGSFYLIYQNDENISPEKLSTPVCCYCCADYPILYKKGAGTYDPVTWKPENFIQGQIYYLQESGAVFTAYTLSGTQTYTVKDNEVYTFKHEVSSAGVHTVTLGRITYEKIGDYYNKVSYESNIKIISSSVIFNQCKALKLSGTLITGWGDIERLSRIDYIYAGTFGDVYIKSINEIDRANPLLLKIIKLPYAPDVFTLNSNREIVLTENWKYSHGIIELINLSTEFRNDIEQAFYLSNLVINYNDDLPVTNRYLTDSKLLHSSLFTAKLTYDKFSYIIPLELCNYSLYQNQDEVDFKLIFKPTNTVNSSMVFKIDTPLEDIDDKFDSYEDYPFYLTAERNNEVTIYNSEYINYIKYGYNRDRNKIERENIANWVGTGASLVGATTGFMAKNPIKTAVSLSMFVNAARSLTSNVVSHINAEQAMQQRLDNAKISGTNITGSNDIDLMSFYSENVCHFITYEPSEIVKKSIDDLFYYCGYSHPVREQPNTHSRVFFNYLQAEPVFNSSIYATVKPEFIDDLIERYKIGVTRYHVHKGVYDFEQIKENWEVNLYE